MRRVLLLAILFVTTGLLQAQEARIARCNIDEIHEDAKTWLLNQVGNEKAKEQHLVYEIEIPKLQQALEHLDDGQAKTETQAKLQELERRQQDFEQGLNLRVEKLTNEIVTEIAKGKYLAVINDDGRGVVYKECELVDISLDVKKAIYTKMDATKMNF